MPQGVVPRMAIEWGFLVLLAVGAGIADLRPLLIILVMAIGWVLVVLVELLAWRARPTYAVTEAVAEEPAAPPPAEAPPAEPGLAPEPAPPAYEFAFQHPAPPPAEEATAAEGPTAAVAGEAGAAAGEATPAHDPSDPYAPAPEQARLRETEQRVVHRLEPLKPRPRRRWFARAQAEPSKQGRPEGEER